MSSTTKAPARVHFISSDIASADMAIIAGKMGVYANRSDTIRLALRYLADTLVRTGKLPTPPSGQA